MPTKVETTQKHSHDSVVVIIFFPCDEKPEEGEERNSLIGYQFTKFKNKQIYKCKGK